MDIQGVAKLLKFNNNENCIDILNNITYEKSTEFITLYVVITRKCNTLCPFCEFRGNVEQINITRFKQIYDELSSKYKIRAVHFTGGEPTLELDLLNSLCKYIKEKDCRTETSINTNGSFLLEASKIQYLDSFAVSRHHYEDTKNMEIFGANCVPSTELLKTFPYKQKLHFSCNIIKGYIDNVDEIHKYLDFCGEVGVDSVGFVSLMQINKFCSTNFIDFSTINLLDIPNMTKTRCTIKKKNDNLICKCENYLYTSSHNTLISVYHRYAIKNKSIDSYLVYENNNIKQGFNGQNLL